MKPSVEILGPWLQNRGDGLGLWAVARHWSDGARLGASSNLGLDRFPEVAGLHKVKSPPPASHLFRLLGRGDLKEAARLCRDAALLASASDDLFHSRGWIPERGVDLLLDCSGYAYGDVWSVPRILARTGYFARLQRQGSAVVLLPQAFGPFERPEIRDAVRRLLDQCDLVFARDEESRRHLLGLGLERGDEIAIAPDVTHLLDGERPADRDAWARRIVIVPNARMLDRSTEAARDGYRGFLARAIRATRQHGMEPVLLVHEDNDLPLANELAAMPGCECPVLVEDALRAKGMLGAARGVVASRYHACVSALSQGIPTVGTSWSHKYEALFGDYDCGDLVLAPDRDGDTLESVIQSLADPTWREKFATRLASSAERQKELVRAMWVEVDALAARTAAARQSKDAPTIGIAPLPAAART